MRYIKKKPKPKPITIVYDDREQRPWLFLSEKWPMVKKRLKVGDYSIKGYEDKIAIEKKSGFAELFTNLTGKERARFERFLRKLSRYPVKCIVIEDELSRLYGIWVVLKRKAPRMKLTPRTILYWLCKITLDFGIPVLFVPKGWGHGIIDNLFEQLQTKLGDLKNG